MKHNSFTCDRCGLGYDNQKPAMEVSVWARDTIHKDLCSRCLVDLLDWIEAGV